MATDRILDLLRRPVDPDEVAEIRELWKVHSIAEDNRDLPGLISTLTEDCVYACEQLEAFIDSPSFRFTVMLSVEGTLHQMAVWRAMQQIPRGETRTYGDMARAIKSAPRAVGQACGKNPVPIIIPCHRVVSSTGLGGFMGAQDGDPIKIKQWLLAHERS